MKNATHTHNSLLGSILRRTTFVFGCIVALTLLAALSAGADWTANGRQVSWQMRVPDDWIGGSYDQIRRVMELNPDSRRFLQPFLSLVRDCDAALWHYPDLQSHAIEPSSLTTSTITNIRVKVGPPPPWVIDLTEAEMKDLLENYAEGMRKDAAPGESVASLETTSFVVGGRSAYEATFRVDGPKQGRKYVVLVVVPLQDGRLHTLTLDVDSTRFSARRDEFHGMLRTLQYAK
jgi:hypothetical protein